jgi:formate C-acetyltransferase
VQLLQNLVFFLTSKALCISHTIPDFSKAVYKGLRYMIGEAEEKRTKCTSDSQEEFYHAISEVLQGLITYARNLARGARELARTETDLSLKKNLLEIADIYEWVPEYPARTFREGLTTVWLCWIAVHLENPNVGLSLGRLDQLLHPLYDADITSGRLPKVDDAVELVCYLWLKIGDHVPTMTEMAEQLFGGTGSNQAITVGGVDASGNDAVNDLTYVMLKATELMQLRDPNLNARYHPDKNSKEYLDRLCEVNLKTGATPAIHNDKAVIAALKSKGDKPEWANDYGIVGCVEPVSNGRHYGHSGAILLNLAAALEMTLNNGRHRRVGVGANEPPISFSFPPEVPYPPQNVHDLRKGFELQTQWLIERAVTLNHHFGKAHQDMYPTPILSAFFEGPMDAGKDVVQGGAKINSSGVAIIGLADVADSLSAIEKWVFNAGFISFQELLAALDDNFGNTSLYTRLSTPTKTPIYGNEDTLADWNAQWIVEFLDSTFHKYTNYRGGGYRVGYWTMTTHAAFGKLTQALPNARRAEENFSSGITPCSKRTPVLTTALNSAAGLPANAMSSGVALNIKFTPNDGNGSEMLTKFSDTVEAYCKNGGVEIQFNITDHDRFVKAAHNPDDPEYQKLLVRVSGYTAYFKDLNKNMQKEIIDRTEYLLSKNKMQPHEPFEIED